MLTVNEHRRDSAGMRYIYPVVSRRAGGISIGINLNTNNACNWACIYCQVPNLTRGGPPPIDLDCLRRELKQFLNSVISGDFFAEQVAPEFRHLVDVAFSGNGEPTSAAEFPAAVKAATEVLREFKLTEQVKLRLITNGSLMHRCAVQKGVTAIAQAGGEIWFKLDRATKAGMLSVNGIHRTPEKVLESLKLCCTLAPTWIQTCYFSVDGLPPSTEEINAYLQLSQQVAKNIKGVHLYGIARPSMQTAAPRLSAISASNFEPFAAQIRAQNINVTISP